MNDDDIEPKMHAHKMPHLSQPITYMLILHAATAATAVHKIGYFFAHC